MAEVIRFHRDENVNLAVASGLRQRGIDLTTTKDAGLIGASDVEQLDYARRAGRVIFSEDADFLILAAQTAQHAGIAYARKGTRSIRQIIDQLELIHGVMIAEDMQGHVEYL